VEKKGTKKDKNRGVVLSGETGAIRRRRWNSGRDEKARHSDRGGCGNTIVTERGGREKGGCKENSGHPRGRGKKG